MARVVSNYVFGVATAANEQEKEYDEVKHCHASGAEGKGHRCWVWA